MRSFVIQLTKTFFSVFSQARRRCNPQPWTGFDVTVIYGCKYSYLNLYLWGNRFWIWTFMWITWKSMTMPSPCDHEESYTRLLLHCLHTPQLGFDNIMISTIDNDIVVLCAHFIWSIITERSLNKIWSFQRYKILSNTWNFQTTWAIKVFWSSLFVHIFWIWHCVQFQTTW